ncbi:MAG: phosphatidate cytidylyltransferase [Patescibacteria group bacterium]|nr:phosphatidate cytidylyltransferase [Patescibacteria group bacterium]
MGELAMLRWRLLLGTVLIAVLGLLCWLDHHASTPGIWLFPVGLLGAVLATGEVLSLAGAVGAKPLSGTVYACNVLLLASSWLPLVCNEAAEAAPNVAAGTWPLLALALCVLAVFGGEMIRFQKPGGGATLNIAMAMLAIVYVGLLMSLLAQLRVRWGLGALLSLLLVVKMGDIGAFTVGRLVGRHKIAPVLSPGKTIEGAFGALAFACAGSWAVFHGLVPWLATSTAAAGPWWGWICFGLLVGIAGMVGDLAESLMKRDAGRKDSSRWMPGFGGVLDILDSILLAAPVGWLCWALGIVGP